MLNEGERFFQRPQIAAETEHGGNAFAAAELGDGRAAGMPRPDDLAPRSPRGNSDSQQRHLARRDNLCAARRDASGQRRDLLIRSRRPCTPSPPTCCPVCRKSTRMFSKVTSHPDAAKLLEV